MTHPAAAQLAPRLATGDDVDAIVAVINAAYRAEDFFIRGDRTHRADITEHVGVPGTVFLVVDAPDSTELAAAVRVSVTDHVGHFAMLSVAPRLQGMGLGRVLIAAIEDYCRRAGCARLELEVVDLREELPPYYRSLGFEITGTAPFPVPEKLRRPAHLLLMGKTL